MTTLATKGKHNLLRTLITSYSPTFLSVYRAQHHNWQRPKYNHEEKEDTVTQILLQCYQASGLQC